MKFESWQITVAVLLISFITQYSVNSYANKQSKIKIEAITKTINKHEIRFANILTRKEVQADFVSKEMFNLMTKQIDNNFKDLKEFIMRNKG